MHAGFEKKLLWKGIRYLGIARATSSFIGLFQKKIQTRGRGQVEDITFLETQFATLPLLRIFREKKFLPLESLKHCVTLFRNFKANKIQDLMEIPCDFFLSILENPLLFKTLARIRDLGGVSAWSFSFLNGVCSKWCKLD